MIPLIHCVLRLLLRLTRHLVLQLKFVTICAWPSVRSRDSLLNRQGQGGTGTLGLKQSLHSDLEAVMLVILDREHVTKITSAYSTSAVALASEGRERTMLQSKLLLRGRLVRALGECQARLWAYDLSR